MIEHGLTDSSQYRPRKSISEDAGLQEGAPQLDDDVSVSAADISNTNLGAGKGVRKMAENYSREGQKANVPFSQLEKTCSGAQSSNGTVQRLKVPSRASPASSESDWETLDPSVLEESNLKEDRENTASEQAENLPSKGRSSESLPITVQPQPNTAHGVLVPGLISGLEEDQYGMPLAIFTKVKALLSYLVTHKPSVFQQGLIILVTQLQRDGRVLEACECGPWQVTVWAGGKHERASERAACPHAHAFRFSFLCIRTCRAQFCVIVTRNPTSVVNKWCVSVTTIFFYAEELLI